MVTDRRRPRPQGRPRLRSRLRSVRGSRAAGYPRRVAVADERALREVIGQPTELVAAKIADRLNDLTRQFIERSPFVCVATSRPDGGLDVSPRGDPAGFVRILDERTLLIPDRPGNKLADTLTNLLEDPRIGLLFLIPGIGDTFRVNGRARIVDDAELLAASTVEGKDAEARDPRRDRGGVHAVLEGARPLRPVEPRQAPRPLGAAEARARSSRRSPTRSSTSTSTNGRAPSGMRGAKAFTEIGPRSARS